MPLKRTVKNTSKSTSPKASSSAKTPVSRTKRPAAQPHDPTSDEALLALAPTYAAGPDIPVSVAERELTSLARLADAHAARLARIGITSNQVALLAASPGASAPSRRHGRRREAPCSSRRRSAGSATRPRRSTRSSWPAA